MTDEYIKARKLGEKEVKARTSKGEYPYVAALDDIEPAVDRLSQRPMGIIEIPVELIKGTKTRARQNSFAANFMPLLDNNSEMAAKWSSLYATQISEGITDPVKVYEYLHKFYVQEGNKRVSVCRFLGNPTISADVSRVIPPKDVLKKHPEYEEFMRFYNVCPLYDIDISWAGAYTEIAELLGEDLEHPWDEDKVRSLRNAFWSFCMGFKLHEDKLPDLTLGDAFMVYLRIFFKDALRPQAPDVIGKRILRIKKELLTEASRDRVALVETASDALDAGSIIEKTGTALSKVIPAHTYSPKHPIKVAFLYNGFIKDSSWTADHEKGRLRLEQAGGGTIKTKCYEDCGSSEAFEKAAANAAKWGASVIFSTSQAQIQDALRAAIEYKDIKVLNCSVNLSHHAVRSYYIKLYEAKFLAGLVAGSAAAAIGSNTIGYCSGMPVYGTVASINAFAIGAAMINPRIKIHLEWQYQKGNNWWSSMIDKGIHIISATDSLHAADGSEAYGVFFVDRCEPGEGNDLSKDFRIKHIATPIYAWGKLYENLVKTIIDGRYNADAVDKKDMATNYWWGMISGATDIELADDTPAHTRELVWTMKRDIIDGRFNPFNGRLVSREGVIRETSDPALTSMDIIMMDWLNENVEGEIPAIDTLADNAKASVKYNGLEKSKKK